MKRRRFTKDEKLAALQPVLDGTQGVTQRAQELGVTRTLLQRWLAQLRDHGADAFPGSGQQSGPAAELALLRKQLREAEMERDILKEAIRFFARQPQR